MIELENVSMTYPGGNQALKNVNINIEKGEFVFIVGSSGSGKTTLFRLLLKELDPTEGNITVAGYDYGKIKRKDIPKVRRRIGVVFQNFRLLKDRTIYENVAFAQRVIQTPARYIRRRVPAMLTLVGLSRQVQIHTRRSSQVVSSRELPWREHWSTIRTSYWRMSLQEISILRTHWIS